jgi:hypothetical protein
MLGSLDYLDPFDRQLLDLLKGPHGTVENYVTWMQQNTDLKPWHPEKQWFTQVVQEEIGRRCWDLGFFYEETLPHPRMKPRGAQILKKDFKTWTTPPGTLEALGQTIRGEIPNQVEVNQRRMARHG